MSDATTVIAGEPARPAEPRPAALRRRALLLGAVNSVDYASQFLLSMVLARSLDAVAFGQYRLLWLVVGTAMAFAPMAMPTSLYFYWPRSDAPARRLHLMQVLLYLLGAGTLTALCVGPWNPWLPESVRSITPHEWLVPAFILMWVVACLLDTLPTVDERIGWQAGASVGLALARTASMAAAALLTHELEPVLLALLAFVVLKVVLLLVYISRFHGLSGPLWERSALAAQLRYAAPFGACGAIYNLRAKGDEWVVATFFPLATYAMFSVAALFGPLLNIFRMSVNQAYLPGMSRCHARNDHAGMLDLNSRANVMVATLMCPLIVLIFAFAEDVVAIVYTATYVGAAPVIRIYALGFVALLVETATITLLLQQGLFVMWLNLGALALGLAVSAWAALHHGAVAAAWGSVAAIWLDRYLTLRRVSRLTATPVGRLQDWQGLGLQLVCAVLAGTLAWTVVDRWSGLTLPLARVALGAVLLGAVFAALRALTQPADGR